MHASYPQESESRSADAQRQPRMAFWKSLLMAVFTSSLLGVVAVASFSIYQNHRAKTSVQKSIFIGELRMRELGIVLLEVTHPDGLVIVPAEAILNDRAGTFVLVEHFDRKHSFLRATIVVGPNGDGRTQVVDGLLPGDHIVVRGATRLRFEPSLRFRTPETNCS